MKQHNATMEQQSHDSTSVNLYLDL